MNHYDETYFLRGKQAGVSLYENYRWLPELTVPMVKAMVDHLGILLSDTVLDFGCARGYTVRAFREIGYEAYGIDVSEWAVNNCDPSVRGLLHLSDGAVAGGVKGKYDWIVAKDVLEHIQDVRPVIDNLIEHAKIGVFVVVPLSDVNGDTYVVPDYEKDVTHCVRLNLPTWVDMFIKPGWSVEASYRVPGVKDNWSHYERGNGFITAQRIEWR